MTPQELALYQIAAFDLGDIVEIIDSGVGGTIEGIRIVIGNEDEFLVVYLDNCNNPQRQWWPASSLEISDDNYPTDNVIDFEFARAARRKPKN